MKNRIVTIFALAAIVASCTPRLSPPRIEVPDKYLFGDSFSSDTINYDRYWWRIFADSTLNAYEKTALAYNRDLATAIVSIDSARDQLKNVRSQFLPSFGVSAEAKGEYTRQTKIVQTYVLQPTVSWEVSLFGAFRHAKREAVAAMLAAEWNARAVELSLTAEVATTYFTMLQYERDLNIAQRNYNIRLELAALVDSMFVHGMSTGLARDQAYSLVYSADADIDQYSRAVEQTRLALNVLLGVTPQAVDSTDVGLNLLTDYEPIDVPVGLPSDLLHHRPDVMQAYYKMQAAAAAVGVARAARFPSIAITGSGGVASSQMHNLLTDKAWAWTALGTVSQPLFSFGRLRRNERIARDAYTESMLAYEQSYLQALSDVESALVAITTSRSETEKYSMLVLANIDIADMTTALYRNGMSAYLDVLDAQRSLYDSQMEFVNMVAQQYINFVTLFKALGGGWQNQEN